MANKLLHPKTIASYFIIRSSELDESNDLTNLKLQKVLFYAQAEYIKKFGKPLFDEAIEAWSYGPVVSSVYQWLKGCGAYPISAFDVNPDASSISVEAENELMRIWDKYSKYSAGFLVEKTHEIGSPWDSAFHRTDKIIHLKELINVKLADEWS